MELLKSVSNNTTATSELRRVIDQLPVRSEFKDSAKLCGRIDVEIGKVSEEVSKIVERLDKIDVWQKIKLPFIIGLITLVLYSVGFFFTLNRVATMIESKHVTSVSAPAHP